MAIRKTIRRDTRPDYTLGNPALGQSKVNADEAIYEPPDHGPFRCDNCIYYIADNQPCIKVSDPIEAAGCCILFESAKGEAAESGPEEEENVVKYRQAQQRDAAVNVVINLAVGQPDEPDADD